jgi:hypothetical protein
MAVHRPWCLYGLCTRLSPTKLEDFYELVNSFTQAAVLRGALVACASSHAT